MLNHYAILTFTFGELQKIEWIKQNFSFSMSFEINKIHAQLWLILTI